MALQFIYFLSLHIIYIFLFSFTCSLFSSIKDKIFQHFFPCVLEETQKCQCRFNQSNKKRNGPAYTKHLQLQTEFTLIWCLSRLGRLSRMASVSCWGSSQQVVSLFLRCRGGLEEMKDLVGVCPQLDFPGETLCLCLAIQLLQNSCND